MGATSLRWSSLRKQGPITTGLQGYERPLPPCHNEAARRMGPRVRRDDIQRELVIPAKAGIQYSRAAGVEPGSRGVLDRPVKPGDDS